MGGLPAFLCDVQQKFEGLVGVIHERCCGENAEKFQSVGQKTLRTLMDHVAVFSNVIF